jgi:WD40 repeat protein
MGIAPDGKTAVLAVGGSVIEGGDVLEWDITTGKVVTSQGGCDGSGITVSSDCKLLLTLTGHSLNLYDVSSGRLRWQYAPDGFVWPYSAAIFSPDGRFIAAGDRRGSLDLVEVASGKRVRSCVGPGWPEGIATLAFSADGKWLLSGGDAGSLKLWDVSTGRPVRTLMKYEPRSVER